MLHGANILQCLLELHFQILKTCGDYGWICNYWYVSILTSPITRVFCILHLMNRHDRIMFNKGSFEKIS